MDSVSVDLSIQRKALKTIKSIIKPFAKISEEKISYEIFSASLLKNDISLGLNASMIAFEKIAEDQRPWNWHKNFLINTIISFEKDTYHITTFSAI